MFTLEQVTEIHERLGGKETLGDYLRALREVGIATYDSYIADGHSEYHGFAGEKLVGPAFHEKVPVAETCDENEFLQYLKQVEEQGVGYLEMSRGLAGRGVEKWTFDTTRQIISYLDQAGNVLLTERVE